MISSLQKNALPLALVLLCAAAMYMVYRDMRRMEARMAQLAAIVDSLADRSGADDVMFNMLDAVCPLPEVALEAAVPAAAAPAEPAPAEPAVAFAQPDTEAASAADDPDMEERIRAAVEQATAAA